MIYSYMLGVSGLFNSFLNLFSNSSETVSLPDPPDTDIVLNIDTDEDMDEDDPNGNRVSVLNEFVTNASTGKYNLGIVIFNTTGIAK